jgi:hypothetical protein
VGAQGAPSLPGGPGTAGDTQQVTDTTTPQLPGGYNSQPPPVPGQQDSQTGQPGDQPMMQQGPPTSPSLDQSSTKPRQLPGGGEPPPGQFDPAINGGPQQVGSEQAVPGTPDAGTPGAGADASADSGVGAADSGAEPSAKIAVLARQIRSEHPGVPMVAATRVARRVVEEFLVKEADWPNNPLAYESWADVPDGPLLRRLGPRPQEDPEGKGEPREPDEPDAPEARVPDHPVTPAEHYDPERDDPEWYAQYSAEERGPVDLRHAKDPAPAPHHRYPPESETRPIGNWLLKEHGKDIAKNLLTRMRGR